MNSDGSSKVELIEGGAQMGLKLLTILETPVSERDIWVVMLEEKTSPIQSRRESWIRCGT